MVKASSDSLCKKSLVRFAFCFLLLVFSCICMSSKAFARDLDINRVKIDATIQQDGTMHVVETRTFHFDGSYNGVYWNIPCGHNTYNNKDVDVSIQSVTVSDSNGSRELYNRDSDQRSRGSNEYYEINDQTNLLNLKIYSAHQDTDADITIEYDITNVVTSWADTAELYWKFVSDGWSTESKNVTTTIYLPVPSGESIVAGDTVRAWGHGPLDASVSIKEDSVVYEVPGVGTDEFAEARITFPTSWVSDLAPIQKNKLDSILSREQAWAEQANQRRETARIQIALVQYVPLALFVLTVVAIIWQSIKYKKVMAPQFTDTYFRDIPSNDPPAVLSMLYNGETIKNDALTATLMHLSDEGYVSLNKATKKGFLGKEKYDYCLIKKKSFNENTPPFYPESDSQNKIDSKAMQLFFDKVAGSSEIDTTVTMDEVGKYASSNASEFSHAYDSWVDSVKFSYNGRFGTNKIPFHGRGILGLLIFLDILGCVLSAIFGIYIGASILGIIVNVLLLIIVQIIASRRITKFDLMNREGIEVLAKTRALRKWLTEFTNLHEAIPDDVILWNKLLVMAAALGVADKVIEQLKVVKPELVNNPQFMPVYSWYYYGDGMRMNAIKSVTSSVAAAHSVSAATLASSSSSSGGGFGGGFSGGGGGGFGGGGGGGGF